ncbi:flagellar biosynthesis regulator FlaF [Flexibacterium corallicola]|uniref:flagellar biosynthesis regulator FlaF n=1 Tax=Flexibacterium corallicola TaxID=3037259 RepID=UPI00286EDDD9|nr:flagellar biosynthesis regulator FlaF [Pseudovibrio sp. M1P-2-3]
MYQMSYAETLEDSGTEKRSQEKEVFTLAIVQLRAAKDEGVNSEAAAKALTTVRKLWGFLIEDLGSDQNALPEEMRARLISIGLWCLKQADLIRTGASEDFNGLIEINQIVRDGLG